MGCGSSTDTAPPRHEARRRTPTPHQPTPPPREPTPPPREPTPPPREPTPPPPEPTPPPREPTPPPREPTPPPREPTPPPREPTPPPREPTPPPREPTPPPREPTPPPPPPQEKHAGKNGYRQNDSGLFECDPIDFRPNPEEMDRDFSDPPTETPFVDRDFGPEVAIEGETFEWKRPHEFRDAPVLFSEGTTRYDIGQGSAGTCWFLSMVAMLADRPKLFHRVVPMDAWNPEGGYFYCNFWRFGGWETVFIDDFLPVIHGDVLWGAKSAEDKQEMWPAFLEKAFARFHGNYNAVYGGQSSDAFLALTGGCSEYIDFDDALEADAEGSTRKKSLALHKRLKNAIRHGESMITTEVPEKNNNKFGLVGGHAYSLTDAVTVNSNGQTVHLVRVRNPWGNTEWTGPWSDKSREWNTVDPDAIPYANKDDGEFWIALKDFIKYFSGVTLCSLVPDFDKDGCTDSLNHCSTIYGEWFGETAAGFQNKINNPRYMFELSDEGMDDDGLVPVVLQICQKLKHRKSNKFSIRVDLYKVLGERSGSEPQAVMVLLGEVTNIYKSERQMSTRFKVEPGQYAVVPSCIDAGKEKEFLVKVYTPAPIYNVREIGREYAIMESEEFKCPDEAVVVRHTETVFGRWTCGHNAGGQISHQTYYQNPQIEFEIPDRNNDEFVDITIMQEKGQETYPVGLRIYPMDPGYDIECGDQHQQYLYSQHDNCPRTLDGNVGAFIMGSSAEIQHKLPPGQYFVLFHLDGDQQEKRFAVIIRSSCHLQTKKHHVE
ncbi:calpain-2 catalytic subunit-like [Ruditapes philippinarum]|uniref:calpain-2 catalytic subunit-like n=1 Tax=Ruditapes philippinarum TaxID=129788 RepID=UPI00295BABAB|nr:calpain-2 catalytic subunit-like [Ruditapes philippinarum]